MTTITAPATLATTDAGESRPIWKVELGEYVWHRGAFRRVTCIDGRHHRTLKMGRYVLHSSCSTVEVWAS